MNNELLQFRKKISRKLLVKMLRTVFLFVVVMAVLMFLAWMICEQYIWYESWEYDVLHYINTRKGEVLMFLALLCALVVMIRAYRTYLSISLEKADMLLLCDIDKMQRVFDNLLRNAVNYIYPDTEIQIDATQDGAQICLRFLNHGATIRAESANETITFFVMLPLEEKQTETS